ncbi:hypothetical protein OIU85_002900 [Salix viminalis]|uniref:Fe-S metabolism associated domain-containing protein n=1 Tax=Salix viminalis TaxID=40686 RepID=A0A9Q0VRU1_SALVM|nr:hypothetical protein OIU85_002900 [Salix viminalis]
MASTSLRILTTKIPNPVSLQPIDELPPKLQEIIKLFQSVQEPKAKYEQLLFYGKNLKPLASEFKTRENKVEGCVSQVWVRAYLDFEKNVVFEADSDSVLTKGLAALLVQGLSSRPIEEVLRVSPDFAVSLGLQQSLTPSRNNGSRGIRIREKLERELSPVELEVEDISYQHAGHAGVRGSNGETHFNVKVVSKEFEGKSLVKRHRLIYNLLQDELQSGLHALSIVAKTLDEVDGS